jgi:hypothetical protein
MNLRSTLQAVAVVLSLACLPSVNAAILSFDAQLEGGNEVPPAASPGTGTGYVEIDTVLNTMRLEVSFMNLLGLTTAAHIHCCTPPTGNAGVATQVPSFVGFPLGVTSGTYVQVFDMSLLSSWNPAFVALQGGTALSAFDALVTAMLAGQAYLNVHTNMFPGGEIRGTLLQRQKVPEPATLVLMLTALSALLIMRRRRTVPAARHR